MYVKVFLAEVTQTAQIEFPLARVEIDHTHLDLFVVDEKDCLPLGRPYLTLAIDVYTRCILGAAIEFFPPSYLASAVNMIAPSTCVRLFIQLTFSNLQGSILQNFIQNVTCCLLCSESFLSWTAKDKFPRAGWSPRRSRRWRTCRLTGRRSLRREKNRRPLMSCTNPPA